jgi:hypothetical protein
VTPLILHDRAALFRGDAAKVIAEVLKENTIDAVITDPPAGIAFMGKTWDSDKGGRNAWIAWLAGIMGGALRVLKPGGYGLIWALPRTSHWTACALEDAGFEIRDVVVHLFGTGFPKSKDASKAIDERAGLLPLRKVCAEMGITESVVRGTKAAGLTDAGYTERIPDVVTEAITEDAQRWEGWGTALKPACEHWILVRKPLAGTIAENLLTYGTGAINIAGCRIDGPKGQPGFTAASLGTESRGVYGRGIYNAAPLNPDDGRWPANVVLSHSEHCEEGDCAEDCPVRLLDAQAPKKAKRKNKAKHEEGASRFFYVAKPARSERDHGCEHLPKKSGGEATDRTDGSDGIKNPRAGAGRGGGAHNFHPTVKSQGLMRWLVRLITPPGGTVLDMFAGSGSTGVAALAEGCEFVGVELDEDGEGKPLGYGEIAKARISRALAETSGHELTCPVAHGASADCVIGFECKTKEAA